MIKILSYTNTKTFGNSGERLHIKKICTFLAATISSRSTPWLLLVLLLLLFFFFLWIMMMLLLNINFYNLVSLYRNLMKPVLNWRISHCLSFPGNNSYFFPFFWKNLIPVCFEVLKLHHLCMDCHEVCFKW